MKQALLDIRKNFVDVTNNFEQELKALHEKEIHRAEQRGRYDGLENVPPEDAKGLNAVERELFNSYSSLLQEFRFDVEGLITHLRTEFVPGLDARKNREEDLVKSELKELEGATYRELKRLEDSHHEALQLLEKDIELLSLKERYFEADNNFNELAMKLKRRTSDIIWDAPDWLYFLILALIGLAEVAAIYNAFLSFEEPPFTTWVYAIFFGFVMAALAHFNGIFFSKSRVNKSYVFGGVGLVVLAIVVVYFVSVIRVEAMDDEIAVKGFSLGAFIAISMAIYIVGTLLSFLTHDSDNEFYRSFKVRENLQEQISERRKKLHDEKIKMQAKLHENENEVNLRFEKERKKILSQREEAAALLRDAISLHDEILQGAKNFEKMINFFYKECVECYRRTNAGERKDPDPKYWSSPLPSLDLAFHKIKLLNPRNKSTGLWNYNQN